jgi:hypothetical protein
MASRVIQVLIVGTSTTVERFRLSARITWLTVPATSGFRGINHITPQCETSSEVRSEPVRARLRDVYVDTPASCTLIT